MSFLFFNVVDCCTNTQYTWLAPTAIQAAGQTYLIGSYYYTRTTNGGVPFNKCFRLVSISPTPVGTLLTYVGPETDGVSISYADCASCTGTHPCVDPSPTPTPTVTSTITPTITKTSTVTPTRTPTTTQTPSNRGWISVQECCGQNRATYRVLNGVQSVGTYGDFLVSDSNGNQFTIRGIVISQTPSGTIVNYVNFAFTQTGCNCYAIQLCCQPTAYYNFSIGEFDDPPTLGQVYYFVTDLFSGCGTIVSSTNQGPQVNITSRTLYTAGCYGEEFNGCVDLNPCVSPTQLLMLQADVLLPLLLTPKQQLHLQKLQLRHTTNLQEWIQQ